MRRQKDITQTIRSIATGDSAGAASGASGKARGSVSSLFERSFNSPNAAYREYLGKFTEGGCRSFAELHNSTTAEQRVKAMETIAGYERDLKVLVSRGQNG